VYIVRTIEQSFIKAAATFPVVLVTGARQAGKTTLLRHLGGDERAYVTLDDPLLLNLAKEDPALLMQRFSGPVLIDEIQYAPELLPHIKMAVDENRVPGRFWLTGSQQFQSMRDVSESLAGRVGILQLLGFSHMEAEGRATEQKPFLPDAVAMRTLASKAGELSLQDLYARIWRGSFPSLVLNPDMDRDLYLGSYVQTYLQRDVRDLAQVGDEMAFLRFLRTCAARTAQICNMSELARDADVAPNTARTKARCAIFPRWRN
jgi:predicted AAA+ superfamily ATPase